MALLLNDDRTGGTIILTDPGFRPSARQLGLTEPGHYPAVRFVGGVARTVPEDYVIRQDVIDGFADGAAKNLSESLGVGVTVLRAWEEPGGGCMAELAFDAPVSLDAS